MTASPATLRPSSPPDTLLILERDQRLAGQLAEQLTADGHRVELAHTEQDAQLLTAARPPCLLLLGELEEPHDTLNLLKTIRASCFDGTRPALWPSSIPVIVLSSRSTHPDLLRAFDAGADDYLTRPLRYLELRARLRAVLRRAQCAPGDTPLSIGALSINPASYTVTLHNNPLQLRRLEYELLAHLASNPSRVFRREELLDAIWGYHPSSRTRTVDSHASRLRRKLAFAGEHWVLNVRGVGYRLTATPPGGCDR